MFRRDAIRKKPFILIVCILIAMGVSSCSGRKFDMKVESPIEFYTPVISSVPGFPLRIILPDEMYFGEYMFKWITDAGRFLDWEDDGRVTPLGRQTTSADTEIFWTPVEGTGDSGQSAELEVHAIRIDGGSVDSKMKFRIFLRNDGLYVLDVGN